MTSEEQLRARLRKIEALFAGATTPREREAAEAALARYLLGQSVVFALRGHGRGRQHHRPDQVVRSRDLTGRAGRQLTQIRLSGSCQALCR
jgi:hypothetical protein